MKIVINTCYGGFGLSDQALKRVAELLGKKAYFFTSNMGRSLDDATRYEEVEEGKGGIFSTIFTVKNPSEVLKYPEGKGWFDMSHEEKEACNALHKSITLPEFRDDRSNPLLIQVIEELGDNANSRFSELKIVEIPDGTEYEIEEYDGNEWVAEKHQTWS